MYPTSRYPKALVVGANGYLGEAVGRAFVRAGWETFGLIRRPEAAEMLSMNEITPVIGSLDDPSLATSLASKVDYFDTIIVTVEDLANYTGFLDSLIHVLCSLSEVSRTNGVTMHVLLSSGMKDYGETGRADTEGLQPHTEESEMHPPHFLKLRAENCARILEHGDAFDATLIRPSNLYGLSGSTYGYFFHLANKALKSGVLELPSHPKTILHSLHVDDCAEAFVALASPQNRDKAKGSLFNIAGSRYETLEEIGETLVKEYGISGGVKYTPRGDERPGLDYVILGFSQWISSDRIRETTGWSDRRPGFCEAIHTYRIAFEAALAQNHPVTQKLEYFMRLGGAE